MLIANTNLLEVHGLWDEVEAEYITDAVLTGTVCDMAAGNSGNVIAATAADPIVITSEVSISGLANGDTVALWGCAGNTLANVVATVANVNTAAKTFELEGVDGTGADAYIAGGIWAKAVPGYTELVLAHVAGTSGIYRTELSGSVVLVDRRRYQILIRGTVGSDPVEWVPPAMARFRR